MVFAAVILALCSPFLYIIGFTLLFSKVFAHKINQPLQLLIDASKKIQEKISTLKSTIIQTMNWAGSAMLFLK